MESGKKRKSVNRYQNRLEEKGDNVEEIMSFPNKTGT